LVKFSVEFSEPEQKWRKDAEGNLSAESSGPEHEWRKDAEENLSAFVNNAAEAWNRLSHSQVEKSVQAYKQSLTRTARIHHRDLVYKEIKTTLNQCNIPEQKVSVFAETLTEITLTDSTLLHADPADSINVRCRCRTVEALYGLRQLIDSGKMANHFSRIMSCLICEQVTATVIMSEEDFNKCLNSLTGATGEFHSFSKRQCNKVTSAKKVMFLLLLVCMSAGNVLEESDV